MNRKATSKGGNLIHSLPEGTLTAVCGYTPSSKGICRMKDRSGWWTSPRYRFISCVKCRIKLGLELKARTMPIKHATVNPQPASDTRRDVGRSITRWADAQVATGRDPATVNQDLDVIINYVRERFFDKHKLPGVTYYFHEPSDSHFILGPHDRLSDTQMMECDELTRDEYLERTAL